MGGFGTGGLDYGAVKIVADVMGIEFDAYVLAGIKVLENKHLEKQSKEIKASGNN